MAEQGARPHVAVIGAGGLGSYVGAVLARAGHEVDLIARGEHAEALRTRGLEVRAPDETFMTRPGCRAPGDETVTADVVFVAVKAYSLAEVAPVILSVARGGGLVVPLLNGVDVGERLAAAGVPPENIVDGVAYLTAFRVGPGVIERKGMHQRIVVGSSTGQGAGRSDEVRNLFKNTAVEVSIAEDIRVELWLKMAVVCSLAVICGLTGSAVGSIRRHAFGSDLQARAISEVLQVGRGSGVPLGTDAEAWVGATLDSFPADFYPSVLHDLRSGRRTEMDALAGTVARLGRSVGIETPLCDAATCAVALMEARKQRGPE